MHRRGRSERCLLNWPVSVRTGQAQARCDGELFDRQASDTRASWPTQTRTARGGANSRVTRALSPITLPSIRKPTELIDASDKTTDRSISAPSTLALGPIAV